MEPIPKAYDWTPERAFRMSKNLNLRHLNEKSHKNSMIYIFPGVRKNMIKGRILELRRQATKACCQKNVQVYFRLKILFLLSVKHLERVASRNQTIPKLQPENKWGGPCRSALSAAKLTGWTPSWFSCSAPGCLACRSSSDTTVFWARGRQTQEPH